MAPVTPKSWNSPLGTHLPRGAHLPWEAWGALESRATRSATLTLGTIATLWRTQPASGPRDPGVCKTLQSRDLGSDCKRIQHSPLSQGRPNLPFLPEEDKSALHRALTWGPIRLHVRGFTFLPSSPGSPGSPCGQKIHISPQIHFHCCLAERHWHGGPQVTICLGR